MTARFWVALAAFAALGGCRVDDGFLDTRVFFCDMPTECGDGWGCLSDTPYTPGFCAETWDDSCDGGRLGDQCVRGCLIRSDGTPGSCQSDDFSCVRTSVARDEGLCYPIETCATSADCPSGQACLTELVGGLGSTDVDNLYCIPTPDEAPCPGDTMPFQFGGASPRLVCLARCSSSDTACPPAFGCFTQLELIQVTIDGMVIPPFCQLGGYGLACEDDSNCFVGSCHDTRTAQARICTVTCDEASRLTGGCQNLIPRSTFTSLIYSMECDPDAPSSDGSGLCTSRYSINIPCTQNPDGAFPCRSDLDCRESGIGGREICTKDCIFDGECNEDLPAELQIYECNEARFCAIAPPPTGGT